MPLPNLVVRAFATVWVGTTVYCLARVVGKNTSHVMVPLVKSDFDSPGQIDYLIKLGAEEIDGGTLVHTTVMLDALSTANIWQVDKIGFNFIAAFSASLFTEVTENQEPSEYHVNIKFAIKNGAVAKAQFAVRTKDAQTEPTPP